MYLHLQFRKRIVQKQLLYFAQHRPEKWTDDADVTKRVSMDSFNARVTLSVRM